MKSTAEIKPGRAFVYRGPVSREDNAQRLTEKAEGLKLVGRYDDADRASKAAERLRRERKPVELLPLTLVKALGGKYDPISVLVKNATLTAGHARVALALRDHEEGGTISIQGGMDLDRVDGKSCAGPEAAVDARRIGRYAWGRAEEACEPRCWRVVRLIILGKCTISKGTRYVAGDTPTVREILRTQTLNSLEAAAAYLGVAA